MDAGGADLSWRLLRIFSVLILLCACGDRPYVLDAGQVVSLKVGEVQVLGTTSVHELVLNFNEADYRRSGKSGLATHRLTLVTRKGQIFTLYRISDELVEVGLRHGDVRKKFFLESPGLSEEVRLICEESIKAGP